MQGAKSRAPTTKKRKQHTFNNKGNERRHDANEEILYTIEEALDEIGAKDLEAAKKSLETGGQYGLARYADIHYDVELRLLQRSLPYVVKNGVTSSTFNKYKSAWDKWLRWSDTKHISGRPGEYYVAIYFNHLLFVHHNRGCLTAAFYGVRWGHHIVGLESPTENPLVKLAYEGAVRMCAGPWKKGPHIGRDH